MDNLGGNLITIIGGANQGKSYWAKQNISSLTPSGQVAHEQIKPCFVYDYQNTFGETSTKDGDLVLNLPLIKDFNGLKSFNRCRYTGESDEFLSLAHCCRGRNILIEEATIFFQGQTNKAMRKLMVDRYHHKNNILIMFHSINAVNPRILEMSNFVVLFKTGDSENVVKRKYDILSEAYKNLRGQPDRSKKIIKLI